ncbi:MAG: MMPL family transporter [Chloroflexi bacterium]|nr:MMPL family transporter [Chloroflexota bacterium]
MTPRTPAALRFTSFLEAQSGWLILLALLLTLALAVPMVLMTPDRDASDNPGGPVYDLQDTVDSQMPRRIFNPFFLAEARDGDFLTQQPLLELFQNSQKLRQADALGQLNPPDLPAQPYLYDGFDADRQQPVIGIFTIADAVQEVLAAHHLLDTNLAEASEDEVKIAINFVFNDPRTDWLKDLLSESKQVEIRTVLGQEIEYWTASAYAFGVFADNELLGGGGLSIGATSDPTTTGKEHFGRKAQEVLRGDQRSYQLWGVAIDASLEIADEVNTAVPFILATVIAVLIVVGVALRSGLLVILTAVGLIAMIIWLKGLSNLVGLNASTTLDFIVPIAMISLGADFVIHAVNRYRQERRLGLDPRRAFRTGIAAVLTALTLAFLTDSIAFLSNASANIETVIGFGIGAALATTAAFVILGLVVPVAYMRLEARSFRQVLVVSAQTVESNEMSAERERSRLVTPLLFLANRWRLVLVIAAVVTAVAAFYALKLEATFDVKDFFKSDSDFVVGLDKIDEHLRETGGEPAIIYIRGDLTDPATLGALDGFRELLATDPNVAKNDFGEAAIQARPLFAVMDHVMNSDYALAKIEESSGVSLKLGPDARTTQYDGKSYRWPGSREQIKAIYDYISVNGVPQSPTQNIYDHLEVRETLFHDPLGAKEDATTLVFGVPGTREQANVIASRKSLTAAVSVLAENPAISFVGLTGSPYTRQASLDATTNGLQRAFPIALVACFALVVAAMRSVRYGLVSIVPIVLVVAWLYAAMSVFGFGLNFITATIAAISIGVGIDYSVHFTERFRQELKITGERERAMRRTVTGTGAALIASSATSIIGFVVMAFAPMPMFAAYGILTAIMIFLAAVASLLVLPSLLYLVTPSTIAKDRKA